MIENKGVSRIVDKSQDEKLELEAKKKSSQNEDTSKDVDNKQESKQEDVIEKPKENNIESVKKKVAAAGAVTSNVAKGGMILNILHNFQMLLHFMYGMINSMIASVGGILGLLHAGWSAIVGFASGMVSGIGSFFGNVAGAVSSFFGIGLTAATVITVGGATAGMGGLLAAILVFIATIFGGTQDVGTLVDCSVAVDGAINGGELDNTAMQLQNAKAIYSILKVYGCSDEQIAGVLGNFSIESSIDPTAIEGIYDEKFTIFSTKKQEALSNMDAYTRGPLADKYDSKGANMGPSVNGKWYTADDGLMYCGIGMGQYTGGGGKRFLIAAQNVGTVWWSIDFQMAYTLAVGSPATGAGFWERYKAQDLSAADAGTYFSHYWEGNTKAAQEERRASSESWYAQISSWEVDKSYANRVIEIASELGTVATDGAVSWAQASCVSTIRTDRSSLADAAVSYAYATHAEGNGNNGTALYQQLHRTIFPGDGIFQSCDRGIAVAIRWSGSDATFPKGSSTTQYSYLRSSSKWKYIGSTGSLTMSDLMPGDVFALPGHVFVYVGNAAVQRKYPGNTGDSVSASYGKRSPGVGIDATDIIVYRNGQDWNGRGEYSVFRLVQPDNDNTYANAGASAD